jgi:hypothetical protein
MRQSLLLYWCAVGPDGAGDRAKPAPLHPPEGPGRLLAQHGRRQEGSRPQEGLQCKLPFLNLQYIQVVSSPVVSSAGVSSWLWLESFPIVSFQMWAHQLWVLQLWAPHTDKKENLIFLIYKKIQNGAVAKSYMTNDLLIYGEIFAHFLILVSPSSYMTLQVLHSEFPYILGKFDFLFISAVVSSLIMSSQVVSSARVSSWLWLESFPIMSSQMWAHQLWVLQLCAL